MFVDPAIGDSISINDKTYKFTEAPNAPGIIYAEIGRKAKVYRLLGDGQYYALKAFKPRYRSGNHIGNTYCIALYKDIPGLAVADRVEISPEKYPNLVSKYNAFAHAILMPWIDGNSWFNYVAGKKAIAPADALQLARGLVDTVFKLEQRNLAHSDLSSSNFIFSADFSHIELVDIEDMFGNGLLEPTEKPKGTGGYTPEWVKLYGAWEASGDCFALGILVSEILGWQFDTVREASSGDTFFAEGEFSNNSRRFRLLSDRLETIHPELSKLFKTVWYAESFEECPRIADWKRVLESLTIPILEVSPTSLNFGVLNLNLRPPTYPQINLSIKNAGGSNLQGNIAATVPWLNVQPQEFSCLDGESSQHRVTLKIGFPNRKGQQDYKFDNGISIWSNVGSRTLSGNYSVPWSKTKLSKWVSVIGIAIFLLTCLVITLAIALISIYLAMNF